MKLSIADKEGAGLGGAFDHGSRFRTPIVGVDNSGPVVGKKENAVRFEEEIAFAYRGVDRRDLLSVDDAETDRCSSFVIHSGVHHPNCRLADFLSSCFKGGEISQRFPGGVSELNGRFGL